ncbi:MAG: DUF2812 domain-containing protein [Butyricicoccus sp.]|nr:DUF2812 domain-containing protein [Butyricicoccus sp.]
MKDKKFRLENYQFYDFTAIEQHLAKMAARGWRLEKIGRMGWHYRRAPAKKLTYAVDYFEKGSDFHAALPESQQTFLDYCEASGWQLVGTWAQMMILVSEEEHPVPIETEPATRLRAIERSMWKNYLPGSIIMLVLAVVQLGMMLTSFFRSPIDAWSGMTIYSMASWLLLGFLFGARIVNYFGWVRRARCAVENGEDLPRSNARWISISDCIGLVLISILLFLQTMGRDSRIGLSVLVMFAAFLINIFLTDRLREFMKRKGVSTMVNRIVSIAFCGVFTAVCMSGTAWYFITQDSPADLALETYTYEVHEGLTRTVTLERDPMPLKLEDFSTVTSAAVSYESRVNRTPFLTYSNYWQLCYDDWNHFDYQVLDVHLDLLYDVCLNEWIDDLNEDVVFHRYWKEVDPTAWNAQRVYRTYWVDTESFGNEWLICWEDRIVRIDFEDALTDAQIAAAADRLAP